MEKELKVNVVNPLTEEQKQKTTEVKEKYLESIYSR